MPRPTKYDKRIVEIEALVTSLATAGNTEGRPTKYTPERVLSVLDLLEEGNTLKTAASLSGITRETLNEWRKQYSDFSDAVDNALALAERYYVQRIRGAARMEWSAAKFWLTHRNGDDWRPPKETKEVTGKDGQPLTVKVLKGVSMDDL